MEIINKHFVAVAGDQLTMLNPPRPREALSREDALLLAAWLVALAETKEGQFQALLTAVQNS